MTKGRQLRIHSRRSRVVRLWAGLAALLVVPATTIGVSASAAGAAGSNALTVKAGEYVYQLKGSPKAGWTQITFDNTGVEDHMIAMFKLKKGVTNAQLKKAILANDQAAIGKISAPGNVSGTPALVGPGQKTTTLSELPAGHYGMACFVPAPDGSPHAAHGMFKVFDVAAGKSTLKPPTDGVADVTLTDTGITTPSGNAPKNLTAKVTNSGTTPHSFQLIKLNTGRTLDEAKVYFDSLFNTGKAEGEAPGTLVGGVESVAPGGMAYLEWSLPAGTYAYVSTDGNAPDDDYAKGLKGEFTIA
jgi:hypothetical protein